MARGIEAKIIEGLYEWFKGIPLPSGAKISYPNKPFTPPTVMVKDENGVSRQEFAPYVKLAIEKNDPVTHHIGGGMKPERRGILLATVCWPRNYGIIGPAELAQDIRDRFAYNTRINYEGVRIHIVDEPRVAGDDLGDVYSETPVIIYWRVYP